MKAQFKDIWSIDDVRGIVLFSFEGEALFKEFLSPPAGDLDQESVWSRMVKVLGGAREADMVFSKLRFYFRKTSLGYIMVVMGTLTPFAMLRLTCDTVIPSIQQAEKSRGIVGFFKRKK